MKDYCRNRIKIIKEMLFFQKDIPVGYLPQDPELDEKYDS
jgi:hypothetical protein